ncbi:MAG: penicillin acylase family protein [Desulfobacter sp.]|nr:MAG: penicillin acylase family protein [Desulfobacter sp.]
MLKKILIGLAAVLLTAIAGGSYLLHHLSTRSLPDYEGTAAVAGLSQKVTIYRDRHAVPHITAENEEDLYFAVGYTLAQDRLWQMDLLRRVTQGRLAEIFGEDLVEVDLLMRALRIPDKSKRILAQTEPPIKSALEQFSAGVNHYIKTLGDRLPPEFTVLGYEPEPWQPEHSVNLVGYMAWDLTLPNSTEPVLHKIAQKVSRAQFKEMLPGDLARQPAVYETYADKDTGLNLENMLADRHRLLEEMGLNIFTGSNNWAVAGKKSATGRPILANDMHLGLNAPGLWYQMHQKAAGGVDVTGVVLPGQPFVICGHNRRIAWGMTNVMVDDMDFYRETLHPEDPGRYEFNGEYRPFTTRTETIRIKGGKERTETLKFTHRGPVVSRFKDLKGGPVSMKWLGNDPSNELKTVYLLNRAGNWEEFKYALRTFRAVSQNVNYADVDGNIGLYCSAGIPIRKKGDGLGIVPGRTDEYDWAGVVPFEEQPHVYNPASGFVSSANNKTAPDSYPYYISRWYALNYRIGRIREVLGSKEKLSLDDFKRLHSDFKSKMAETFTPFFLEMLSPDTHRLSPLEKQGMDLLQNWDGVVDSSSGAAALFELMYTGMVEGLVRDELGPGLYKEFAASSMLHRYLTRNIVLKKASAFCDDINTRDKTERLGDIIRQSFSDAVARLRETCGDNPENWAWGEIHQLALKHPLGKVKLLDRLLGLNDQARPVGGSFHTVCPMAYKLSNPFVINHGASHRHIYHTGDWDRSLSVIPTGISGIPASPHYCDQTGMYAAGQYHPDLFTLGEIKGASRYTLVLTPRKK